MSVAVIPHISRALGCPVMGEEAMMRSIWPQSEPLAFRQMTGSHHHEVAAVECGHLTEGPAHTPHAAGHVAFTCDYVGWLL
jgi:hypothetical protein